MTRLGSLVVFAGLCLSLGAASVLAMPPVLERVPDDAMAAVAIPAPTQFEKNVNALQVAIDQQMDIPSVKDLLAMSGFGQGVDETKSMALVFLAPKQKPKADDEGAPGKEKRKAPEWKPSEDDMLALLPITSYADLLKNFDVKPAGEGKIDVIMTPDGSDGYVKDIGGGYAVLGTNKAAVEGFTGKSGANPVKARMGKAGEALADASDLVLIVNMEALRPMAEEGIKAARAEAKDQIEAFGQDVDAQLAMANWIGDMVVRDTRFAVGGIKLGAGGVNFDMVGTFKEGSYLGNMFAAKGDSAPLLSRLPAGPFLAVGALDTSGAGIKQFLKDLTQKSVSTMPGGEEAAKISVRSIDNIKGQSAVVGFPMGGALAGLLTSTVVYTSAKDAAQAMKDAKDRVMAMNDYTASGMTFKAKVIDGGAKAGETPLDVWDVKIESDGTNQTAAQGLAMIYGPQGSPGGYLAKTEGGLYQTFAKNSELMGNALKVGSGVEAVTTDKMLLGVQEQLPAGRLAEGYLGAKSILDLALPFAAMAGATIPADKIPEKLPPLGIALSAQDGAGRFSIFIPSLLIKTGSAVAEGVADMQNDGMNGGEDAAPAKPKDGSGQPRF